MKFCYKFTQYFLFSIFLTVVASPPAMAYVGPGAGLVSIAAFIAFAVAIVAALFGFLWFPIKRLLSKQNTVASTEEPLCETEEG
ncbi:hypothetical protein [Leptothoe kymatousa]|uniref:Uncharacterized protein n=1 Tax=Leptothoe kymatousa TAU-MAC 1615 TaxID=2364775 RepID=A0ABS5Y6R6_9CYAN|nr:hypothetical protein [Leptothoe kymatousa]MBT9312655.1 hypothetical protein [Leptothoe kymatousa TAU-MAC 1615]